MKKILKKITAAVLLCAMVLVQMPSYVSAAETTGTFTAAAMNVDGLPQKILIVDLNPDGPGSDGTKKISNKVAEKNWDFFGVSEDFNFHTELMSGLTGYQSGTYRGKVSGLTNNTDGLNLIWKNTLAASSESWVPWKAKYSSGFANTGNGADHMIDKGYRFYQMTVADGITVDVYILHMDAASDPEDIAAREAELEQLSTAIKASDTKNPIIVMGDTNCRYTREKLKTDFIDVINADPRFTIQDCWIEKCKNGVYPAYGSESLMVGDLGYEEGEIVDKMFYINNTDSDIKLTLNTFKVDTDFDDTDGTPLADHYPIVGEFTYTKTVTAPTPEPEPVPDPEPEVPHEHSYTVSVTKEATCTEDGVKTFNCECGESYTETISATGHAYKVEVTAPTCTEGGYTTHTCTKCGYSYKDSITGETGHKFESGTCTVCGAEDPNYSVDAGPDTYKRGSIVEKSDIDAQNAAGKYAIFYYTPSKSYALKHTDKTISGPSISVDQGSEMDDSLIWTIEKAGQGYYVYTEVNGSKMYLAKGTTPFTGAGYRVALQEKPFTWYISTDSNGGIRLYYKNANNKSYYLRYYNDRQGWIANATPSTLYVYGAVK